MLAQCERVLNVSLDVRTRWNSTLEMLRKALKVKEPIEKFLKFWRSAAGKKEFKGSKTKLDFVSEEQWALIQGVCHLLASFDSATKILSGEQYSTFVTALPVLRSIKKKVSKASMFDFENM